MVKEDLINNIYEIGFTRQQAIAIYETVFNTIKDTLKEGEDIHIVNFGSLILRNKKERIGRNPRTGQEIMITPRRVLTFKPSKHLKKVVLNA